MVKKLDYHHLSVGQFYGQLPTCTRRLASGQFSATLSRLGVLLRSSTSVRVAAMPRRTAFTPLSSSQTKAWHQTGVGCGCCFGRGVSRQGLAAVRGRSTPDRRHVHLVLYLPAVVDAIVASIQLNLCARVSVWDLEVKERSYCTAAMVTVA